MNTAMPATRCSLANRASPAGGRLLTATTPRGEAVNDGLASFDILTS